MGTFTTVSARIDSNTKQQADAILRTLGLSPSAAIAALYAQIVLNKGLPFAVQMPQTSQDALPLGRIKRVVSDAARRYGVDRAWLFGSYARGVAKPDSDVDILIDKGSMRGLALGGFLDELEHELQAAVDVVTLDSLDEDFRQNIQQDQVLLYER
ncbi:type II toxin-antitoxin system RelB/DinJ family antitoxin [Collinsella tanakaei]|uniref:type II toxin-antitoxin system RelB/DinJ family antitoxin n=1 Tax=Collinsella tanakaei TaxID=626935 RepID=UPI0025A37254|nr:type II toxin-antitoxin system RelB/DinJ family antitoxin [Collinsella tanakaei]MDM8302622.1 type II toxin-antitoxin system RelB/DinJ family antitoxin [Collinsella tanakaei]